MQKFTDFSKKIKQENNDLLIQEANSLNINCEDMNDLINALDILCENYILSYLKIHEEFTQADLDDVIYNMPDEAETLVGYEAKIGSDTLTVDWEEPKKGIISLALNGEKINVGDERAYDYETVKQVILNVLGKLVKTDATDEPKKDITPEAKKKLMVLRTVIRPRLINKFANEPVDQNRIYNAIKNYLETGEDEDDIKTELDQKAIIDFCLDMLDVILSNKNLASLISRDSTISSLSESKLEEGKKRTKSKKNSEESIDVKLDMLLKLGLVDSKIYNRAKRALSNKKSAGTVPYLRNLLFDLLDKLISYIKKDTTLYNRIRLNVMKEMKANLNVTLPMKKEIEEATMAGKEAASQGKDPEVPETYSKHYFTKEAWLEGYNSFIPVTSDVEEIITPPGEEMKTFSQFKKEKSVYNESISLSEIDAITNVVEQLAAVSGSSYSTLEEALSEISDIVAQLGLSFNTADVMDNESGTVELPLEDLEGQAMLSVFGGESVEDKVEGDLSIKIVTEKNSDGIKVTPEIMVSFEGDETVALSDIEFEVDIDDDEEEPEEMEGDEIEEYCDACDSEDCNCDEMELTEEYVDGETFNVILFKPATRRFFSVIISAKNEKEIADIVAGNYPEYTINAIYPVKVS